MDNNRSRETLPPAENYIIEYEVTKDCNLDCSYCFESEFICPVNADIDDRFIAFVKKAQAEISPNIEIIFWGGEPTLNMKSINAVCDAFDDDPNVSYMTYTNGFAIDELIEIVSKRIDRWTVQISYDGMPIQDINRLTRSDNPVTSGREALHSYGVLFDMGAKVTLKSTLPVKDFDQLHACWLEFAHLHDTTGACYAPTIDGAFTLESYDIFKTEIKKIFKDEYKRFQDGKDVVFKWIYHTNDIKCGNGENYITVDVNGDIYPCHGAMYSEGCKGLNVGTIEDADIFVKLQAMKLQYNVGKMNMQTKCVGCVSLNCHVCNMNEYDKSEEEEFGAMLNDRTNIKHCAYFKLFGKYGRVFLDLINGEK